jgi:hypothetical protein
VTPCRWSGVQSGSRASVQVVWGYREVGEQAEVVTGSGLPGSRFFGPGTLGSLIGCSDFYFWLRTKSYASGAGGAGPIELARCSITFASLSYCSANDRQIARAAESSDSCAAFASKPRPAAGIRPRPIYLASALPPQSHGNPALMGMARAAMLYKESARISAISANSASYSAAIFNSIACVTTSIVPAASRRHLAV